MDAVKRYRCERFYETLPNAPEVLNAAYDPMSNTIFMPIPLDKKDAFYFQTLYHELGHERLQYLGVDALVGEHFEDLVIMEQIVCEVFSCVVCNHLEIIEETIQGHVGYLREWKAKLRNPSLLTRVFPIVQRIAQDVIGRDITREDLPLDIKIQLGLF